MPGFAIFSQWLANLFIPKTMDGLTVGEVSLIRPSAKNDVGVIAHEARHRQQQAAMGNIVWLARYGDQSHFKLSQEAEAYAYQLAAYPAYQWTSFRQEAIGYMTSSTYGLLGKDGLDVPTITQALDNYLAIMGFKIDAAGNVTK